METQDILERYMFNVKKGMCAHAAAAIAISGVYMRAKESGLTAEEGLEAGKRIWGQIQNIWRVVK